MKLLKIWVLCTLLAIATSKTVFGAEYPDFIVTKQSSPSTFPRIREKNVLLASYTIYVKTNGSWIYSFYGICTINNRQVKNFRCLYDSSSLEIGQNDSLIGSSSSKRVYAGETHTIEFYCDVENFDSTLCPSGNIVFELPRILLLGWHQLDTFSDKVILPISTASLEHSIASYFPDVVKSIDTGYVNVGQVDFFATNELAINDTFIVKLDSDYKKVKKVKVILGCDTIVKSVVGKTVKINRSDTLKVGKVLSAQISFVLDTNFLKVKDSIIPKIELISHDHCVVLKELVTLPTLRIDRTPAIDTTNDTTQNVGVKKTAHTNTIAVYPNPTSNMINITGLEKSQEIIIIDISGRKVLSSLEHQIDVSSLSQGMYYILCGGIKSQFFKL